MAYLASYSEVAPDRAEIDVMPGMVLIEFGVDWCPHCQGAQPFIEAALGEFSTLPHLKVEDGPGRRLGRSFRVKLWPTLILLRDGQEIGRVVRPANVREINELLLS
ncbi:thioredoxin family protein [Dechloromonas sp. HYN0024]|uniref:thioredoxin family protein n=1 Tax=Dechloromonas sp. HYN0024 TaxID=2231055 RepID=UPI000E44A44D|nr:thioredoxin family protein [Dechloromonas sp. HYN0024]AXS81340.1 thioredoxin [Dechloromonas sp. HYN0024]